MVGAVMMRLVSSAYVYTDDWGAAWVMSFMYSRKSVVERVLPWGMPWVMVCLVEVAWLV